MRALIQRVSGASVWIDGSVHSSINKGLLIYLGIHREDTPEDIEWLIKKLASLRIFNDENGRLARSISEAQGEVLVVSQVTLYGSLLKGTRPDMSSNKNPKEAEELYSMFLGAVRKAGIIAAEGKFGADMQVESVNDGPITFMADTRDRNKPGRASIGGTP